MNCEQFEKRVQQQLDKRANLSMDLAIQRHARSCRRCAHALTIYSCLVIDSRRRATANASPGDHADSPQTVPQRSWKKSRLPQLLGIAAGTLLMTLALPWAADSPDGHHSFVWNSQDHGTPLLSDAEPRVVDQLYGVIEGPTKWISEQSVSLASVATQIDWSSFGDVDLVSLMPQEPIHAVQMLPVAFQTIEPIYRYSYDWPVVNYWSSSINYTIGLIRYKLPVSEEAQPPIKQIQPDLGHLVEIDFHLC